jgi:hypothetical protein
MPTQVDYNPFSEIDPGVEFVPPGTDLSRLPRLNIGGGKKKEGPTPVDYDPFAEPDTSLGQYAGLTGRAAVQAIPSAVLGLPALGMDAYDSLVNLTRMGMNTMRDQPLPMLPAFRHSGNLSTIGKFAADEAGLPQPTTQMQEGVTDIGTIGLSALGGAGAAKAATKAFSDLPALAPALKMLGDAPLWQTLGALGGATATEAARSFGVENPLILFGLSTLASAAPGGAANLGKRTGAGMKALAMDPFTQKGREYIAGTVLNRLSTNPTLSQQRMEAAQPLVPGSLPTIAQVSQDAGLIGAERPMIASFEAGKGRLEQRMADQNLARNKALDNLMLDSQPAPDGTAPMRGPRGTTASLEYATAKRDAAVDNNMTPAFRASRAGRREYESAPLMGGNYGPGYTDLTPVLRQIETIRSTPIGAGKDVQAGLKFAEQRLTQGKIDLTDPEVAYSVRKDMNEARLGKYDKENPNLRLASGVLARLINTLDGAIDKAAPGFRRYLDLYSKRSKVLDQQKALRGLRQSSTEKITDPIHGVPVLTMGNFGGKVRAAIAKGALGKGPGKANLSDKQMDTLVSVVDDIDRGSAAQAATVKTPGSDTFKNLSVANIIGRVLGRSAPDTAAGKGAITLMKPLSWFYSMSDEAIGAVLVEAALDPKLAARLMKQANAYEMEAISKELAWIAAKQMQGNAAHNQN